MGVSFFLARVMCVYFLVMGITLLLHREWYQNFTKELMHNRFLMFVFAVFGLIIGALLVVAHTIITADWRIVITILAWIALLKSIAALIIPDHLLAMGKYFVEKNWLVYTAGIVFIVIGLFLGYHSYLIL